MFWREEEGEGKGGAEESRGVGLNGLVWTEEGGFCTGWMGIGRCIYFLFLNLVEIPAEGLFLGL